MKWRYYTHKPTEIRAAQWQLGSEILPGMLSLDKRNPNFPILPRYDVEGLQCAALIEGQAGYHMVKTGDYICRGERGELYPVPPEIFEHNYVEKPGQPRQPVSGADIERDIQSAVQDSVDRKGDPNA